MITEPKWKFVNGSWRQVTVTRERVGAGWVETVHDAVATESKAEQGRAA